MEKQTIYLKMLLAIFMAGLLVCCDKGEEFKVEEQPKDKEDVFIIEAYFNTFSHQEKKYPDFGAKVYLYFDITPIDFMSTTYLGDGIYDKRGKIIRPDESYTIDEDGRITIERLYPERVTTIIVESNSMKPMNSFHLCLPYHSPVKIVTTFTFFDL